jgi:acyl-CoA dehydrogenase
MNLDLAPADLAFRDEVRAFLDANLTEDLKRAQRLNTSFVTEPEIGLAWHKILYRKGWIAPGWPKEHGGTGWSLTQRYIFDLECARAGAPYLHMMGLRMVGPVIMGHGTPAQKSHYLPRILSGEDYWCQGYSEPEAGSDLAALKTRARRDGDDYVLNGSKIWTTHAHHANRMFGLVRTAESAKRQDGITFLLFDMKSPGITVRPIITIGGDHEVNQVFFDDVRVPVANRLGEEGRGWQVAKYLLEFERGGGFATGSARALFQRLVRLANAARRGNRAAIDDPDIARRLGEIGSDIDALEMMDLMLLSELEAGQSPGVAASVMKLRASEIRQSISTLAVELLGSAALRWQPTRPLHHAAIDAPEVQERAAAVPIYLNERAHTIFAGSSEVQLGIISKAMLGL